MLGETHSHCFYSLGRLSKKLSNIQKATEAEREILVDVFTRPYGHIPHTSKIKRWHKYELKISIILI